MKKLTARLIALSVSAIILLGITACAKDFAKTRTYSDNFTDVSATAWYASDVKSAYELGFVDGMSDTSFAPDGNMTVAQAITLVSRLNAIKNDRTISEVTGGKWYDMYVAYAKANGIIKDNQFDSLDRNLVRHEMATLFVASLGSDFFASKNVVDSIPDVPSSSPYYNDVMTLYKAGVVMGSDDYGTFNPNSNIKRSEVAAIVNRAALPQNRLTGTLAKREAGKDAFLICQVSSFNGTKEGLASGWQYDGRGGVPKISINDSYAVVTDISTTEGTALIRPMNKLSDGTLFLRTSITLLGEFDGLNVEYLDEKGNPEYVLSTINGGFSVQNPDGSLTEIKKDAASDLEIPLFIALNLDNKTAKTYINGEYCGESKLLSDNVGSFRFASAEKATISYAPGYTLMYANYNLYENFDGNVSGFFPIGWTNVKGEASLSGSNMCLDKDEEISKSFEPVSGKSCYEIQFILPEGGKTEISFGEAVKLEAKDGAFYVNGKNVYPKFTSNMWYRLRVEADLDADNAKVYIAGQDCGNVSTNGAKSADVLTIKATNPVKFFNARVSSLPDHDDYVPEPVPTTDDDYTIGLNVCSLWREGTHWGWTCISPFDEQKTLLGYYDEGSPESADWEIKWMSEHGIDFQAFCWYADQSNAPIRTPNLSYQLNEGYQYAKYSDKMNYCLLWEAQNASHPQGSAAFRKYFVPYWVENYFKDPRYMKIDNKLVMCIFGLSQLVKDFGSNEGVKDEMDYLRKTATDLGYDGMIILACGTDSPTLKACGIDGSYAYNWGTSGYTVETNKNSMLSSQKVGQTYAVPTVSVGFNNVGWAGTRHPNMSVADFKTTNEWVRDTYLTNYPKENWQKNFLMLSTWNEYGEGTYIMPSGLNEFGYLDVLREVYTGKGGSHTDVKPTDAQLERVGRCYPQYYRLLRSYGDYKKEVNFEVLHEITYKESEKYYVAQMEMTFNDTGFDAKTTGGDPVITTITPFVYDCSEIKSIRVNAKVPKGSTMQLFYITTASPSWSEDKSVRVSADSDAMKGYIFNVSGTKAWTGSVTAIRLDPTAAQDNNISVGKLEFLGEVKSSTGLLYVNGIEMGANIAPEKGKNGAVMYPFDPAYSLNYMLNLYYEWDYGTKVLKVLGNRHEIDFTVGSSKAIYDGKETDIGETVYQVDNIPMLPIAKLCELLGYSFEEKESGMYIVTPFENYMKAIADSGSGNWQFETLGNNEGWSSTSFSLLTSNGSMRCVNKTSNDPIIMSKTGLAFEAAKYSKIELRVKYKLEGERENDEIGFYFITDRDSTWDEHKHLRTALKVRDTGDEFVTLYLNTKDYATWAGTITQLRFDPFNQPGIIYVDYIQLIEDPDYVPEAERPFEIKNGDAETANAANAFFSDNANVSIIEDPDKAGNHVYSVVAKNATVKAWTYFRQNATFKPGKTYTVEYDIKAVSLPDGTKEFAGSILCNFRYMDENGKIDHVVNSQAIKTEDGWVHVKFEAQVPESSVIRANDQFSIFANPVGELAMNYYVDNVVVTEKAE